VTAIHSDAELPLALAGHEEIQGVQVCRVHFANWLGLRCLLYLFAGWLQSKTLERLLKLSFIARRGFTPWAQGVADDVD
jgi:hypothetical protein